MASKTTAILHYSAPPTIGGVEAVMEAHTREFLAAGYPVTIVAGRGDQSAFPLGAQFVHIPELDSQHPEVVEISAELERGRVPKGFDDLAQSIYEQLRHILPEFDCVIVHNVFTKHFNMPLTAALYRILDANRESRWIAWCHDFSWTSSGSMSKVHSGFPWDLLRHYRSDLAYVTISKQRQAELAGLLGCSLDKVQVIYNGVDPGSVLGLTHEVIQLTGELNLMDGNPIMLMPVRITRAKNIELAIRVAESLIKLGLTPKLIIVGPPDPHDSESMNYFNSLLTLRDEVGLHRNVHFIFDIKNSAGEPTILDNRSVGELYRLADIVFIPSHREGFGMPVLEAGLAGVHVVSAPIPATVEIGGEDVTIIKPGSEPDQVAELIHAWMQTSPAYRLRRKVRQELIWSSIFRRFIEPLIW